MKQYNFKDETEMNIRISCAMNQAIEFYPEYGTKGGTVSDSLFLIKGLAINFLDLFEEIKHEVNYCKSCGGLAGTERVVNGLHYSCRSKENFKAKDL